MNNRCGHCQKLAPIWDKLESKILSFQTSRVIIGKVDCTEERDLCSRESVMGYPTLKLYKAKDRNGIEYEGERDLLSLETYLRTQLGDRVVDGSDDRMDDKQSSDTLIEIPKPINGLYELNDEDIEQFLSKGISKHSIAIELNVWIKTILLLILFSLERSTFRQILRPVVWTLPTISPDLGPIGTIFRIRHFSQNI